MLVLSRKPGQTIQIGEKIRITVVSVEGGRVRIGIEAPREMAIYRSELLSEPDGGFDAAEEPYALELDLEADGTGMELMGAGR